MARGLWIGLNVLALAGLGWFGFVYFTQEPVSESDPVASGQRIVYSLADDTVMQEPPASLRPQSDNAAAPDAAPEEAPPPEEQASAPAAKPTEAGETAPEAKKKSAPVTAEKPDLMAGLFAEEEEAPAEAPVPPEPATTPEQAPSAAEPVPAAPAETSAEEDWDEMLAPLPRSNIELHPARDRLLMDGPNGELPIIGADGTEPWEYYARPFAIAGNVAPVALIMTDLGMNKNLTDKAILLPEDITMAVNPYAPNAAGWAKKAREMGHEVLLQLPMEPANYPYTDPGPHALLNDLSKEELESRLQWNLAQLQAYVGVLSPADETFTTGAMNREVFKDVKSRGLLFIRANTSQQEPVAMKAGTYDLRLLHIDEIIDDDISTASIQRKLKALKQKAESQGYAIGLAHPYKITIAQVNRWARQLQNSSVVLAPVSAIEKIQDR